MNWNNNNINYKNYNRLLTHCFRIIFFFEIYVDFIERQRTSLRELQIVFRNTI